MLNPQLSRIHLDLAATIPELRRAYHRLAILCGPRGSGKTAILRALNESSGYPLLNVNLILSQQLLDYTLADRPHALGHLFRDLVRDLGSDVVLLDNIELLFDGGLSVDPLGLLQSASRNVTLVGSWGGAYTNSVLTYAVVGHPEYRAYRLTSQSAVVIPL